MPLDKLISSYTLRLLSLFVLLLGTVLRLKVYFQNRSFIIDESNLARNVVEKGFVDFFGSLDHGQYAPPLYLMVSKLMVLTFGVQEYSLTFISLLAGIGALVFLYLIAKRLELNGVVIMYLLLLFSFSELAIRYSTEFKQYALDAFLILVFVYWFLGKKEDDLKLKYTIQLSLIGGVAIWLSMPIIFLLAAIGLYYLKMFFRERATNFMHLVMIGVCWLTSFGIYYFMILKTDSESDYLQNFHQPYFFDLLPMNLESANRSLDLLLGLFRSLTDKTAVSLIGTIALFVFGCVQMIRQNTKACFLLLMPVLLCLIASHLELYSLLTRLTLFMVPLLLLIFGYGFSELWQRANKLIKMLLVAFMLLTVVNKQGYQYLYNKMEFEDAKTALGFLETNRLADEAIYIYHSAGSAFKFYNELHKDAMAIKGYYTAQWDDTPGRYFSEDKALKTGEVFWLYYTHTDPEEKLQKDFDSLIDKATKRETYRAEQAIVVKYEYR